MIEQKILNPGGTYLFTKEILGINNWFPYNQKKWAIETARKNLAVFLLPVGRILAFSIVKNKLLILVKFHEGDVLEKVPKESKNQSYLLSSKDLDEYVSGKLPPIATRDSETYAGTNLSESLRKRFANFLQSFSIQYNNQYDRKDRLSARYTGIFELTESTEIKKVITEIQNTPLIHDDKRELENCNTNSYHLEDPEIQKVISYKCVLEFFESNIEVFRSEVRAVRKRLKALVPEYKYLQQIPPGGYIKAG